MADHIPHGPRLFTLTELKRAATDMATKLTYNDATGAFAGVTDLGLPCIKVAGSNCETDDFETQNDNDVIRLTADEARSIYETLRDNDFFDEKYFPFVLSCVTLRGDSYYFGLSGGDGFAPEDDQAHTHFYAYLYPADRVIVDK